MWNMSVIDKALVWWREVPVDVEMGLVEYLSSNWKGKIYIVSCLGYENERKACKWGNGNFKNVKFIYGDLEDIENKGIIDSLLLADAIHIFSGIKGLQKKYLKILKRNNPRRKDCVLICESPSLYGSKIKRFIKKFLYPIIYGCYWMKYGKMFSVFFTMGQKAGKIYSSYGWDSKIIYPFMYLPIVDDTIKNTSELKGEKIKGVYIGRFMFSTKGTDDLMRALDILHDSRLEIDFAGGYGEDKDQVIEWCANCVSADYVGMWASNTIVKSMSKYDFVVVPSKYDGWNMAPYQSICAGIGCIVSDKAGSEEIIENSGSGVIFQAGNYQQLSDILSKIILDKSIVDDWKKRAVAFQDKISINQVGSYFIESIKYQYGEIKTKPYCPWSS